MSNFSQHPGNASSGIRFAPRADCGPDRAEGRPVLDVDASLQRLGGDTQLLADLGIIFEEDAPPKIAALRDALQSGQRSDVERPLHSLKGLAAAFDAHPLMATISQMERHAWKGELAEVSALVFELQCRLDELVETLQSLRTRPAE